MLAPWKKSYDQPRQHIKKQRHHFADKGRFSQSYCFSSSHVWMWELDYKESWAPKNWCFWTVVLEKTLESPMDCNMLTPWKKSYDQPRQHIKKQRHYFANKSPSSWGYGFFNSHVWMWELDYKESAKELMLLNYGVGEDSWESLGLQGDPTSPS